MKDDATSERYVACVERLLDSHELDALIIIHAPSAVAPATETAERLIAAIAAHPRGKQVTLLTNWSGEFSSQAARRAFTQAGIPAWRTPEGTMTAFMHQVEYRRNQKQLRETPALPASLTQDSAHTHQLLSQALDRGITALDTHEVQPVLQAYGLATWIASDSAAAMAIADQIGYPVALKLRSPDIAHKSDVQG